MRLNTANFKEIKIPCLETKSYWIEREQLPTIEESDSLKFHENISQNLYLKVYENTSEDFVIVVGAYYGILLESMEQFKVAFLNNSSHELHVKGQTTIFSFIKDEEFIKTLLSKYAYKKNHSPDSDYYILTFEDGRILETTEYLEKITSAILYNNMADYNNHMAYIRELEDLANSY